MRSTGYRRTVTAFAGLATGIAIFGSTHIADNAGYLLYVRRVQSGSLRFLNAELFFNLFVYVLGLVGLSAFGTVLFLRLGCIALTAGWFQRRLQSSRGAALSVAVCAAIFAPLLALVTLRATVTYLVITSPKKGRRRLFLSVVLSCFVHVGALFVLVAIGFDRVSRRLKRSSIAGSSIFLAVLGQLGFFQQVVDLVFRYSRTTSNLSKYSVYARVTPAKLPHIIFFLLSMVLFIYSKRILTFVPIKSLVLLQGLLMFSPVVSFRLSIFWILPVLSHSLLLETSRVSKFMKLGGILFLSILSIAGIRA